MHQDGEINQGFKYQLGIGFNTLNSTIRFDDEAESEFDIKMNTVSVSGGIPLGERGTMNLVVGVILNGELKSETDPYYDIKPGGFASIVFEYSALTGKKFKPYIDCSLVLGGSMAETENTDDKSKIDYMSSDARLGVRSSWNINNRVFPFAAIRAFGGPVMWEIKGEDVIGSDIYHYQVAIGSAMQLGPTIAYFEWAGLGEQSLKTGLSFVW